MISYCAERLLTWGEWSRMRLDGWYGVGIGAGFGYDEPMPRRDRDRIVSPSDPRCLETEEAVGWLWTESAGLGSTVCVHYRDHPEWSVQMQATLLRVGERQLYHRIDKSHSLLLGYFLDRAVGLMPQTEELRLQKRQRALAQG